MFDNWIMTSNLGYRNAEWRKSNQMNASFFQRITRVFAFAVGCTMLGCGIEMVRPHASNERIEDRPKHSLVIGQFKVEYEGFLEDEERPDVGITRHRVVVGKDKYLFTDEVSPKGRTFALWVYPGVFCLARPTLGFEKPAKLLGKGSPCVEIKDSETAYYIGSVTWLVKKVSGKVVAELKVDDKRESVMASRNLVGIYPETVLVSDKLDADHVAAKYKLP